MNPFLYTVYDGNGNEIGMVSMPWSQIDFTPAAGIINFDGHTYRQLDDNTLQLLR